MDDTLKRTIATLVGAALIALVSWLGSSVISGLQVQKTIEQEIITLQTADVRLEARIDMLVGKLMDLHPMQRSSLADLRGDE